MIKKSGLEIQNFSREAGRQASIMVVMVIYFFPHTKANLIRNEARRKKSKIKVKLNNWTNGIFGYLNFKSTFFFYYSRDINDARREGKWVNAKERFCAYCYICCAVEIKSVAFLLMASC